MNIKLKRLVLGMASIGALGLYGCGGGSTGVAATVDVPITVIDPSGGGGSSSTLTGTAAIGVAIDGTVVAIDSTGTKYFTTTDSSNGAYTLNVSGGIAPFILTIVGTAGGQSVSLTSIATAIGQTVNITPLTDLIVSAAAGQPAGSELATLCASTVPADQTACRGAATTAIGGTRLTDAVAAVTSMIAPLITGVNPLNGALVGGSGTGMDGVLDTILVKPATSLDPMATITLVAVPSTTLASLPLAAPTAAVPSARAGNSTSTSIERAAAASTALSEIKSCMASFNALYPANLTVAPTQGQVTPFIDSTFNFAGAGDTTQGQAFIVDKLSTLTSAGGAAAPGFSVNIHGLSTLNFDSSANPTPQKVTDSLTTSPISDDPTALGSTVWIKNSSPGDDARNWKFIKRAAYAGCPGGWKVAGPQHIYLHNSARISKFFDPANSSDVSYDRGLAVHIEKSDAAAEGIVTVKVHHGSLRAYSATGSPAGALKALEMNIYAATNRSLQILDQELDRESIRSCQDIRAMDRTDTDFPDGTICYDETRLKPGDTFTYALYDANNSSTYTGSNGNAVRPTGTPFTAFRSQVSNVPLSRAFLIANQAHLFAQNFTVTPSSVSALNTALTGTALNAPLPKNLITFNYTQSSVYGLKTDHCSIKLFDAANTNTIALQVERSAVGQQTSCSFGDDAANNGGSSFSKTVAAYDPRAISSNAVWIGSRVLGNSSVTTRSYR